MAGHSDALCAFAEAHYASSKGLPWRPNVVLRAYYISMTGLDSRWIQN